MLAVFGEIILGCVAICAISIAVVFVVGVGKGIYNVLKTKK